jgi:hypothetical protein
MRDRAAPGVGIAEGNASGVQPTRAVRRSRRGVSSHSGGTSTAKGRNDPQLLPPESGSSRMRSNGARRVILRATSYAHQPYVGQSRIAEEPRRQHNEPSLKPKHSFAASTAEGRSLPGHSATDSAARLNAGAPQDPDSRRTSDRRSSARGRQSSSRPLRLLCPNIRRDHITGPTSTQSRAGRPAGLPGRSDHNETGRGRKPFKGRLRLRVDPLAARHARFPFHRPAPQRRV